MDEWTSQPLVVPGLVRHTLRLGDDPLNSWYVSVALPPEGSAGAAPPLYLLDGFLTFLIGAEIARATLAFSLGQLRPCVVVGIAPATNDLDRLLQQRARDLTPTAFVPAHLQGRTPYGTGGAAAMLDLIQDVIAPHVESTYGLDGDDRAVGGVSLGGLFASWAFLSDPRFFKRLLAVSPSLWWDEGLLLDPLRFPIPTAGQRYAYISVGGLENDPVRSWPRVPDETVAALGGIDVVADVQAFAARLEKETNLDLRVDIIPDEQHATIWANAFTRGLVYLFRTDRMSAA